MPYKDKIEALKEVIELMTTHTLSEVSIGDIKVVKHHHELPTETLTSEESEKHSQDELEKDLFYSSNP